MTKKIISFCGNAELDEKFRVWAYRIDTSIDIDEVEIKPKYHVFLLGDAPVWKYCALCCKAVGGGARHISISYGTKNENEDFDSADFICVYSKGRDFGVVGEP
jgi:hypothetical protein